jgi:pyrroline-5-carboxylate reductase
MPNTPALVDQGMAAISPGQHCTPEHLDEAEALLRSCGRVVQVPEKYQDAGHRDLRQRTAYIFYVVEAMIEAGVVLGLPRATSTELVVQTLFGAATMLKETGEHPTVLRERVSSPGGTTVAALRQLDDHKVRAAFISAIEAAAQRSHELAAGNP